MDDSVPAVEITSTGFDNTNYSVERDDLMGDSLSKPGMRRNTDLALCEALLDEIDKMDQAHLTGDGDNNNHLVYNPVRETRSSLEKLVNRMDNLETTFDKMAEKTSTFIYNMGGLLITTIQFSRLLECRY